MAHKTNMDTNLANRLNAIRIPIDSHMLVSKFRSDIGAVVP
jgi:hypothetical protein